MNPILGQTYRRSEIHDLIGGGNNQSYLPERDGRILGGCFDPELNIYAPCEIDAGSGSRVVSGAKLLASKGHPPIPVFLKRKNKSWEYVGDFKCTGFSDDPKNLYPNVHRRQDAMLVIYMERIFSDLDTQAPVDLLAQEGRKVLRTHYVREREPSLVAAKRRIFKAQYGQLFCEVCGVKEDQFPHGLGYSCFEVHHLLPLSQRSESLPTRLSDLIVICANCHRMIHSNSEPLRVEELRKKIESRSSFPLDFPRKGSFVR